MYKFKVGNKVSHESRPNTEGVIIRALTSSEVDGDMIEDWPWYIIQWDCGFQGCESEGSLTFVNDDYTTNINTVIDNFDHYESTDKTSFIRDLLIVQVD